MIKNLLISIINNLIGIISYFIKRDERWIIVGGWFGQRFADNSKAMYLYLFENKERLGLKKVIFVTRNAQIFRELRVHGYEVCLIGTLKSKYVHLKSKYHIIDQTPSDLERLWSVSAIRINLWHGFPLKKFGHLVSLRHSSEEQASRKKRHKIGLWEDYYNLVLSDSHKELQRVAFNLPEESMIIGMYPRITYMFGYIKQFSLSYEDYLVKRITMAIEGGATIIGYFPTFRDLSSKNSQCISLVNNIEEFLGNNNCCLITKMHFASDVTRSSDCDNLIFYLPSECDVNNYLRYCSVLITDYSSVYFDFLLLKRPIVFYAFDLDYYQYSDRGFNYKYEDITPGSIVQNQEELFLVLRQILHNPLQYMNTYNSLRDNVMRIVYDANLDPSVKSLDKLWFCIQERALNRK